MLPFGALSITPVPGTFLDPDMRVRPSLLVDYELGGAALNDPTLGLQVRTWQAWYDGTSVRCSPDTGTPETVLFSKPGITELSLTFDQNMRAAVAYVIAGYTYLWWYDSVPGSMVHTQFAGANSPLLSLDDKRLSQTGNSDILFVYLRDGKIYYRQQRDRFGVEYLLSAAPSWGNRINRIGMMDNGRFGVRFLPINRSAAISPETNCTTASGNDICLTLIPSDMPCVTASSVESCTNPSPNTSCMPFGA